jgi:hypothetical protein
LGIDKIVNVDNNKEDAIDGLLKLGDKVPYKKMLIV